MREDLPQSRCEGNDVLLAQLHDSQQTSHGVQVLVAVKQLTDVLQELGSHFLVQVALIDDCLLGVR